MHKDFFEIQRIESRRIFFLAAILFALYFLIFFAACSVVLFFQNGMVRSDGAQAAFWAAVFSFGMLVFQLWFAEHHGVQILLEMLGASEPDPDDAYHQRLVRLVEEIGLAAGNFRPTVMILATPACNALALQQGERMILAVSEGLVSRLNRNQTQAVVAHEVAHMLCGDCRLATWLYSMFTPILSFVEWLEKVLEDEKKNQGPSLAGLAELFFSLIALFISRSRESRADAKAVELTRNPSALIEALVIISRQNHCIGGMGDAFSPICLMPSREHAGLLSSHPPIAKRIQPLLAMLGEPFSKIAERVDAADQDGEIVPVIKAIAPMQNGVCPECQQALTHKLLEGLPIAVCPNRHGILVQEKRVVRLFARREHKLSAEQREEARQWFRQNQFRLNPREALDKSSRIHCPQCGLGMFRSFFSYQYNMPVDRCLECKTIWFDTGEIDILQALVEEAQG